ncbi:MAG TPA: nickel-dependent lactate racemase [Candidatus Anaerobutyricum stercoripullorum]|uniref:Nickel-dependent lactate racemase n=1 Tax=Candidatus Anaerobutyricum stercoripullorum TaxID=2838456 RepID=A0A9D2BE56_9FIRM|nr:nickel-dependent lactate racemase [Candidatus Anaerobutyricum stercoripullorum]
MQIKLPYSTTGMMLHLEDDLDVEVLASSIESMPKSDKTEDEIVLEAMENPIGSPKLSELSRGKEKVVIICSDHTRPVPSRHIIPFMLKEIREGNPDAKITLLIATGFHRATTREELIGKFGEEIVNREHIVVHDSQDMDAMVNMGVLPSGAPLLINKVAAEADLLVSEGFIETHFFAGFSGGRKSVLPGVSSKVTVLGNHCSKFIHSPYSRTGILENNPIHKDMVAASQMAGQRYIVNVIIDGDKKVVHAVAGDAIKAHEAGCAFLENYCQVTPQRRADIAISTNGGYPLDQNMYQSVKGMTAAEAAAKEDGILIMVSNCGDGHGGEGFYKALRDCESPAALMEEILRVPQDETKPDQWEYQIQARILMKHKVIYVMCEEYRAMAREMGFLTAADVNEALAMALEEKGRQAHITVIPDGVSVMVK